MYIGSRALHEAIKGKNKSELVVMPGGHLVPFENPRDWRKLVLAFMTQEWREEGA
jgi:pimeloyl-ACP methyl ester carboxylesterase